MRCVGKDSSWWPVFVIVWWLVDVSISWAVPGGLWYGQELPLDIHVYGGERYALAVAVTAPSKAAGLMVCSALLCLQKVKCAHWILPSNPRQNGLYNKLLGYEFNRCMITWNLRSNMEVTAFLSGSCMLAVQIAGVWK